MLALALSGLAASAAFASDGYFQHGYGARHKAVGGAGVADGRDSTTTALNPAGLVHAPSEFSMSVSAFMPHRFMEGSSQPGFTPTGRVESDSTSFYVPNMALSYRLAPGSLFDVVGLTLYGNGGMNTDYPGVFRFGNGTPCPTGVFCAGRAGVNLQQAFFSLGLAKRFGNVSVGVAPILARQQFEAEGLAAFGVGGSTDVSWGGGVRAGLEWAIAPGFRFGVTGSSRVYMQKFDKYANLFAEQGDFDIPASVQAGIAYDVTKSLTVMLDYKRIWYGDIAAIANPSTNILLGVPLGADNGAGFGWKDVDVIKVGVEYKASRDLTLRAGYSYNTNPITSRNVMLNVLAPGLVQHHITGGAQIALTSRLDLELAGMYVPEKTLGGRELPLPGANAQHGITIGMHQYEVTAGIKYKLGGLTVQAPFK